MSKATRSTQCTEEKLKACDEKSFVFQEKHRVNKSIVCPLAAF